MYFGVNSIFFADGDHTSSLDADPKVQRKDIRSKNQKVLHLLGVMRPVQENAVVENQFETAH